MSSDDIPRFDVEDSLPEKVQDLERKLSSLRTRYYSAQLDATHREEQLRAALAAEKEKVRGLEELNDRLIGEINSPTFMGEPVLPPRVPDGFFAYTGESFETFDSRDAARKAATDALDQYADDAPDGWNDDSLNVCYGIVLAAVEVTERRDVTPDDPCFENCKIFERRELVVHNGPLAAMERELLAARHALPPLPTKENGG